MTPGQSDRYWPPRFAAAGAVVLGLVNIASALTPNIRWRGHLLLSIEPLGAMRVFHALALPAGAALLLVAPYLAKRRRRAVRVAIGLLLALAVLNLLKGLDYEEALLSLAMAGALYGTRAAFEVDHEPITLRSAVWRVPVLGLLGLAVASVACWASEGRPSVSQVFNETWALLRYQTGPLQFERHTVFHDHVHFAWIPLGVHLIEISTLLAIAYVIFRPLATPRSLPGPGGPTARRRRRSRPRPRLAVVLQAACRQAVLLQSGSHGVRRLSDRGGSADPVGRSGRTRARAAGSAAAAACVRSRAWR